MLIKSALFWDITQRRAVINTRRRLISHKSAELIYKTNILVIQESVNAGLPAVERTTSCCIAPNDARRSVVFGPEARENSL
jgi:hypothetical protein